MSERSWNILGVLIGILLLNLPPFIFSGNITKIDQDSVISLAICVMIGLFGFVFIGKTEKFPWVKKVYVVGAILAFLSNGILFFLAVKSNAFKVELEKYSDVKSVSNLESVQDTSFYQLNSSIEPDLRFTGVHATQLRKAMKSYSYHHVYPVSEDNQDTIRYFLGCITHNGMMGVSLEKYEEILRGGNRIIQITNDPGYIAALDSFQLKHDLPVSKNVKIFSVTDPYRVSDLMHEYLWVTMLSFNGIFFFVLLLFNLKVNQQPLDID